MSRHQESLYRFGGGVDLVSGSVGAASLGAIGAGSYLSAGAGNPLGVPGAIFAGGLAAGSYLHAESGAQKLLRKFESDAGSRVLASFERPVGESYLGRKAKVIALDLATSAASAKVAGMAVKAVDGLPKLSFAKRQGKVDDARITKTELVNKQEVVALPKAPSTLGKAIRKEDIPAGSNIEYLAPGRIKYDGVEFRAVRNLKHLSDDELRVMDKKGRNPVDLNGIRLDQHHYKQKYHREEGSFMVEIPDPNHCISNKIQHPLGNKGGLTDAERYDGKLLRLRLNKERGRTELMRRGIDE